MTSSLSLRLNALSLIGIGVLLLFAFADQLLMHDMPCPLCLLQRACFVAAGFGFALNLCFGARASHYALTLLAALAGASISTRQVLLHIMPGTGTYGEALFGLHFYTWALSAFFLTIVATAVMMLFGDACGQAQGDSAGPQPRRLSGIALVAVTVLLIVTLGNAMSTLLECGVGMCPANPFDYELL
ncbi:disulfide bond formation protein B [Paraburkholderia sediminicola]|uniref:disulfide bond formation protein B n=1 Tax=Paraburkholderia sediminicola TaxID=458836 RepID=UPI0038BB0C37